MAPVAPSVAIQVEDEADLGVAAAPEPNGMTPVLEMGDHGMVAPAMDDLEADAPDKDAPDKDVLVRVDQGDALVMGARGRDDLDKAETVEIAETVGTIETDAPDRVAPLRDGEDKAVRGMGLKAAPVKSAMTVKGRAALDRVAPVAQVRGDVHNRIRGEVEALPIKTDAPRATLQPPHPVRWPKQKPAWRQEPTKKRRPPSWSKAFLRLGPKDSDSSEALGRAFEFNPMTSMSESTSFNAIRSERVTTSWESPKPILVDEDRHSQT